MQVFIRSLSLVFIWGLTTVSKRPIAPRWTTRCKDSVFTISAVFLEVCLNRFKKKKTDTQQTLGSNQEKNYLWVSAYTQCVVLLCSMLCVCSAPDGEEQRVSRKLRLNSVSGSSYRVVWLLPCVWFPVWRDLIIVLLSSGSTTADKVQPTHLRLTDKHTGPQVGDNWIWFPAEVYCKQIDLLGNNTHISTAL